MSEYAADTFICKTPDTEASDINLCALIFSENLCDTYSAISGGQCYWDDNTGECLGTTSCETYFSLYNACPPPCDLTINETSSGVGGRLRFRIFKDLPSANSYGQYYHDNDYDRFSRQTGIITENDVDDLFSVVDYNITPFSNENPNLTSQLSWDGTQNEFRIELKSLLWDIPSNNPVPGYMLGLTTKYHKKMWITVSDMDEWDTLTNYNTTHAYFEGKPAFAERGPWNGSQQTYYDVYCEFGGSGPYTPYGSFWGALSGWGTQSWLSSGDDEENDWTAYSSAQSSEFGGLNNIAHINDDSITNLFPYLQYDWKAFLTNPDAIIIIGQYMFLEGATNINGENVFNNKHYGLTKIPASDILQSQTDGVNFTEDYQMEKMFQDGGTQYYACNMGACCNTYTLTETDGNSIFCPYIMEATYFANANEGPQTRVHFKSKEASDEDLESFNYNFFYNLGGRKVEDLLTDTILIDAAESYGGYNIKWPSPFEFFETFADTQILPEQMYTDWRPIPHAFIGDNETPQDGIYVQKYYDFMDAEHPYASAPNIVNLNMFVGKDTGLNIIDYVSYYDEVINKYTEFNEDLLEDNSVTAMYVDTGNGYIDDGQNGGSRTPPACCFGAGSCETWCSGGVVISHTCDCETGAVGCPPPMGTCYGSASCSCDCTADCSSYGGGDISGCTDVDATNYNPAATVDDGTCYYSMDDVIDIEDLIESYFSLNIVEVTPDCSVEMACTVDSTLTIAFELQDDWEDFMEDFSSAGWNQYFDDFPSGPSEWELELDLGDGEADIDILKLLQEQPDDDAQGPQDSIELEPNKTYYITIEPNNEDGAWEGDSYWTLIDGGGFEFYSESNPGGINFRNHGSYANYYPRMIAKNQYNKTSNWVFKDEYQDSGPYYTLYEEYVFNGPVFTEQQDWIIWAPGCNNVFGDQYNSYAYIPSGETEYDYCTFFTSGCTDPEAINYDANVTQDDGSCVYLGDYGFDQNPFQESVMSDDVRDIINTDSDAKNWLQRLRMFVVNWDFNPETDDDFDQLIFPANEVDLGFENDINNTYKVVDVFDLEENLGQPNYLSHQYNNPGIKIIKAFVFSTIKNPSNQDELPISTRALTIKINLTLDNVYIEDFAETGGPDFKFLPYEQNTAVISGISNNSDYFKSLEKILDENQFTEKDQIDKINLEKAYNNREIGDYLGTSAIEQVRFFKDGTFDIAKLLGIESSYTNFVNLKKDNDFYKYDKFWHWDGFNNKYPEETSVGSIFIDDAIHPPNVTRECMMELNMGESDGRVVIDTSGNGNKGILVGDYKLSKPSMTIPIRRETDMKLPKIKDDDKKAL